VGVPEGVAAGGGVWSTAVDPGVPLGPGLLATCSVFHGPHVRIATARMNATAITANVRKLIMRFSTLGHDSIGWRGFCDELNDFRPSRAWSHHCGLGVRDLALGCWNNSWVSNLFSFTRVQEPRLAKPAPVPLQLGVPTISGLSSPPELGPFLWAQVVTPLRP